MNTLSKLALLPLIFVFVKTPDDCSLAAFLQAVVFVGTAIISNIYIYCKRLVQWHTPSWKGIKVELPLEASDYKELMDELIKKEEGE